MKLVGVSHRVSDILYGQPGGSQKLYCLIHPVGDQKLLRAGTKLLPEDLPKVVPMNLTGFGDIRDRDIILKILVNICKCPLQIIFAHVAALRDGSGCGGTCQAVKEQVKV